MGMPEAYQVKQMKTKALFHLLHVGLWLFAAGTSAQAVTPGEFRSYATCHAIGLEWDVSDDADHDAVCAVTYKRQAAAVWKEALPLYRVDFRADNMVAGSILFLTPDTSYDVRLRLSDPDGGDFSRDLVVHTRPLPEKPKNGRILYVAPGSGGGTGTPSDPFRGIEAAQAEARPGDTFILQSGLYPGETEFHQSGTSGHYIVWQGQADGSTVLEALRISGNHLWFEGFSIHGLPENGQVYGLRTYRAPEDIVVTKNEFTGCSYCIYLNHGGAGWHIADNIIEGNVDPASGSFSGEGIELNHTSHHTVAFNTISRVADGISYPEDNCDIFGNDIFDVSDDGIEGDYGFSNIRIWENRISNPLHNGISLQPMNGAPWYILRNQVAAPLESALKFRDRIDRVLIAHNTFVGRQGVLKSGSEYLVNVQSNNNLYISATPFYAWENGSGGAPGWKTDLDYDGFDWGGHLYGFKWGERYADLAAFSAATGLEPHGVEVDGARSAGKTVITPLVPLLLGAN
jgi:hypothetical protein